MIGVILYLFNVEKKFGFKLTHNRGFMFGGVIRGVQHLGEMTRDWNSRLREKSSKRRRRIGHWVQGLDLLNLVGVRIEEKKRSSERMRAA